MAGLDYIYHVQKAFPWKTRSKCACFQQEISLNKPVKTNKHSRKVVLSGKKTKNVQIDSPRINLKKVRTKVRVEKNAWQYLFQSFQR